MQYWRMGPTPCVKQPTRVSFERLSRSCRFVSLPGMRWDTRAPRPRSGRHPIPCSRGSVVEMGDYGVPAYESRRKGHSFVLRATPVSM